jgi:hypothetical protein
MLTIILLVAVVLVLLFLILLFGFVALTAMFSPLTSELDQDIFLDYDDQDKN